MVPTIAHFLGQEAAVARFRVALEATWNDQQRLPHTLIVGPAGLGKTTIAHLAAKETGSKLIERIGQVLHSPSAINGLLMEAQDKDIVFVDEVHELAPQVQTALYRAMEDRSIYIATQDKKSMQLKLNDFVLIAATTDEYAILPPLRDRFQLILPFTWYEPEVLANIVSQHAAGRQIHLDDGIALEIGRRARGTPRLALRLLEACHRLARSEAASAITLTHFERTMQLEGVDELGLGPDEQKYLLWLASKPGQPVRLFTLASALGFHNRTIQEVIEPFLLRVGLIERTDKGRLITNAGLEHLAKRADAVPVPSG